MTHWESLERPAETGQTSRIAQAADAMRGSFEADAHRYLLWAPVLIAAGAALYFGLLSEPSWRLVAAICTLVALTGALLHRTGYSALAVAVALVALGFLLGKIRTDSLTTPVLTANSSVVTVSGWVERVEIKSPNKQRVLIRAVRLHPWARARTPGKLRISLSRKNGDLVVGSAVSFRAKLFKPRRPVSPDAFDFARRDWFLGIAGSGYGFGEITTPPDIGSQPIGIWARGAVALLRNAIAAAVTSHLDGEEAAFAVAVLTGLRGRISQNTTENLRAAGLAHLLAISGLHMGLIALTLFWLARAVFALSETAALRYPIKKWAAALALIGGAAYLAVSGASVSTQRAFIMIAIMLLAIIVDRPAISMRNVALAAIFIVVYRPESVLSVSFQMSFMAVVCLIALYEQGTHLRDKDGGKAAVPSAPWRLARRGVFYMTSLVLSTIVAALATGPIAAFHFNRVAAFGIVANLIAIPLMALWIMPLALVGVLLIPIGLEGVPFAAAGWGISVLLASAEAAANIPGALRHVPSMSTPAVLAIVVGGLWLCLWRTRLRLIGIAGIALGLSLSAFEPHPDILIEDEAKTVAVRTTGGQLVPTSATSARFAVERWLARDGDQAMPAEAAARPGVTCDDEACVATASNGMRIAVLKNASALWDECRGADIVITTFSFRGPCGAARLLIDRYALYKHGAHALYFNAGGIEVRRVSDRLGNRPWTGLRTAPEKPRKLK